jgi:hypothetical protein
MKPLSEALKELRQDAHDPLDPFLHRRQKLANGEPRHQSFIDRYVAGEVGIYAYVRSRVGDEYVAVLYWPLRSAECHTRINSFRHRNELEVEERGSERNPAVFVDPVQLMERPEPVEAVRIGRIVPTVRLFVLDERDRVDGQSFKPSAPNGVVEDGGAVCGLPLAVLVPNNREHQRFLNLGGERSELAFCERVNRVIERGAEVEDSVTDQEADPSRRISLNLRPSDCVARLGIYLTTDGVGLRPEPLIDRLLSGFYVFTSAIDLQPCTV